MKLRNKQVGFILEAELSNLISFYLLSFTSSIDQKWEQVIDL